DYWNANFPLSNYTFRRDAAQLFTRKLISPLQRSGLGYPGTVCTFPERAYSFNRSLSTNKWIVSAHELGHNLNATHSNNEAGCQGTIMNSIIIEGATEF